MKNSNSFKTYALGRVGELADLANPLTFSLINSIYGYNGPYRNVLAQFGIKVKDDKRSYLKDFYWWVYSDVELENEILWKNSPYKLTERNGAIQEIFSIWNLTPNSLIGLASKSFKEAYYYSNTEVTLKIAYQKYNDFIEFLEKAVYRRAIYSEDYLKAYENVIFLSYLYGVFFKLNGSSGVGYAEWSLNKFILSNDYLMKLDSEDLLVRDISLGNFKDRVLLDRKKIVEIIKKPPKLPVGKFPDTVAMEALVLCLKDNARIASVLLSELLDYTLFELSNHHQKSYQYLYINEIENFNSMHAPNLELKIESRCKDYEHGLNMRAPTVFRGGKREWEIMAKKDISSDKKLYQGIHASPGVYSGRIQEINTPHDQVWGEILIFPNASPKFSSLFEKGKGLVFRTGSPLSHGCIVAREMRVPAVVIPDLSYNLGNRLAKLNGSDGVFQLLD